MTKSVRLTMLLALAACSRQEVQIQTRLSLAMPALLDDVELAVVDLEQDGEVQSLSPDAEGVVRTEVEVGRPLRIRATLLDLYDDVVRGSGLDAFAGEADVVPEPGPNSVTLTLEADALLDGSLVPSFDDGTELLRDLPLILTDVATGFVADNALVTRQSFSLPSSRAFSLSAVHPSGAPLIQDLPAGSFAPSTPLELGPLPAITAPPTIPASSAGQAPDGIGRDPAFGVECALGNSCSDPALDWMACDLVPLTQGLEVTYNVVVRYAEIPTGPCVATQIALDDTRPRLKASVSPPALVSGQPPDVTVTVVADEALDPSSLSVTYEGSELCTAPVADLPTELHCALTIAGWAGGDVDLQVAVDDLAGNQRSTTVRLLDGTGATGVRAVAISSYPFEASVFDEDLLLEITVANFAPVSRCGVNLSGAAFYAPGSLVASTDLTLAAGDSTIINQIAAGGAVPSVASLWAKVAINGTGIAPGTYDVALDVGSVQCGNQLTLTETTHVAFDLQRPDPRWLGNGQLTLGEWTGRSGYAFQDPPVLPFGDPTTTLSSSSAAVGVTFSEGYQLVAQAVGTSLLTVTHPFAAGAPPSVVEATVTWGTAVAVLQATQVLRATPQGYAAFPFSPGIGTPLRVLWEPSRDLLVAVGTTGVQPLRPGSTVMNGCGGTIVDAAITEGAPSHPNGPDVALIVNNAGLRHCELDLDTGAVLRDLALPGTCNAALRLLSNPVTGDFVRVGTDCAVTYAATGTLTDLGQAIASPTTRAPRQAMLDPYGSYALSMVAPEGTSALSPWGVGSSGVPSTDQPFPAGMPPYAIGVDAVQGLFVASSYTAPHNNFYRHRVRAGATVGTLSQSAPLDGATSAFRHIEVDAGNGVIYAVDSSSPPNLWVYQGSLIDKAPIAGPVPLAAGAAIDTALVGPQVLRLSSRGAAPGGVVTALGLGFAGEGRDQVFVQGVRANVLDSGSTWVRFRIPQAFDALRQPLLDPWVTVQSFNSSSSRPMPWFTVTRPTPVYSFGTESSLESCFAPPCSQVATLVDSPSGLLGARSVYTDGVATAGAVATAPYDNGPANAHLAADGTRLLGSLAQTFQVWLDTRVGDITGGEPQRLFTIREVIDQVPPDRVAIDPTGRYIAVASEQPLNTYVMGLTHASGFTGSGITPVARSIDSVDAMEFTPDGAFLAAVRASTNTIEVAAYDTSAGLVPVTVVQQLGLCPAALRYEVVGMFPRFTDAPELLLLLEMDNATLARTTLRREGGTWTLRCEAPVDLNGDLSAAALSPDEQLLMVTVLDAGGPRLVYLLDPDDFGTVFASYGVNDAPANNLLELTGGGPGSPTMLLDSAMADVINQSMVLQVGVLDTP